MPRKPPDGCSQHLLDGFALRAFARRSDLHGAVQCAAHAACLSGTGLLVWLAEPLWYLLIPTMALQGVAIVTLFAPMHECVHRMAFASRAANDTIGWIAGVLSFYNSTYYRYFHAWHHRYTQDPARDPELLYPKARTRIEYFKQITGFMFWFRRALGGARRLPFVPDSARRRVALSVSAQLLIYLTGAVSIALGFRGVLYFWLLPALLA
jgi:fatty acid desaturase